MRPSRPRPELPTLAAVVREQTELSWGKARDLCRSGRVFVDGEVADDPALRVAAERVEVRPDAPRRRSGLLPAEALVHVDRLVAVVNKPPGVLSVRYHDDDRDTLADQLRARLRRVARQEARRQGRRYDPPVGVVHRLDKGTSGLLVFSRTVQAKKHLASQLREHSMRRTYVALVHGKARPGRHDTILVPNRGDGIRGTHGRFRPASGKPPREARRAITHVVASLPLDGASLVACRLETGRQHQIRIHLAEAGHPLVGETVYVRDHRRAGRREIEAPRPMLHACELGFVHPMSDEPVRFEVPPPADFLEALAALGGAPVDWRRAAFGTARA
ncbi:MAG: RluA family pseudouridine synthase [Myxococcota bacterium]